MKSSELKLEEIPGAYLHSRLGIIVDWAKFYVAMIHDDLDREMMERVMVRLEGIRKSYEEEGGKTVE